MLSLTSIFYKRKILFLIFLLFLQNNLISPCISEELEIVSEDNKEEKMPNSINFFHNIRAKKEEKKSNETLLPLKLKPKKAAWKLLTEGNYNQLDFGFNKGKRNKKILIDKIKNKETHIWNVIHLNPDFAIRIGTNTAFIFTLQDIIPGTDIIYSVAKNINIKNWLNNSLRVWHLVSTPWVEPSINHNLGVNMQYESGDGNTLKMNFSTIYKKKCQGNQTNTFVLDIGVKSEGTKFNTNTPIEIYGVGAIMRDFKQTTYIVGIRVPFSLLNLLYVNTIFGTLIKQGVGSNIGLIGTFTINIGIFIFTIHSYIWKDKKELILNGSVGLIVYDNPGTRKKQVEEFAMVETINILSDFHHAESSIYNTLQDISNHLLSQEEEMINRGIDELKDLWDKAEKNKSALAKKHGLCTATINMTEKTSLHKIINDMFKTYHLLNNEPGKESLYHSLQLKFQDIVDAFEQIENIVKTKDINAKTDEEICPIFQKIYSTSKKILSSTSDLMPELKTKIEHLMKTFIHYKNISFEKAREIKSGGKAGQFFIKKGNLDHFVDVLQGVSKCTTEIEEQIGLKEKEIDEVGKNFNEKAYQELREGNLNNNDVKELLLNLKILDKKEWDILVQDTEKNGKVIKETLEDSYKIKEIIKKNGIKYANNEKKKNILSRIIYNQFSLKDLIKYSNLYTKKSSYLSLDEQNHMELLESKILKQAKKEANDRFPNILEYVMNFFIQVYQQKIDKKAIFLSTEEMVDWKKDSASFLLLRKKTIHEDTILIEKLVDKIWSLKKNQDILSSLNNISSPQEMFDFFKNKNFFFIYSAIINCGTKLKAPLKGNICPDINKILRDNKALNMNENFTNILLKNQDILNIINKIENKCKLLATLNPQNKILPILDEIIQLDPSICNDLKDILLSITEIETTSTTKFTEIKKILEATIKMITIITAVPKDHLKTDDSIDFEKVGDLLNEGQCTLFGEFFLELKDDQKTCTVKDLIYYLVRILNNGSLQHKIQEDTISAIVLNHIFQINPLDDLKSLVQRGEKIQDINKFSQSKTLEEWIVLYYDLSQLDESKKTIIAKVLKFINDGEIFQKEKLDRELFTQLFNLSNINFKNKDFKENLFEVREDQTTKKQDNYFLPLDITKEDYVSLLLFHNYGNNNASLQDYSFLGKKEADIYKKLVDDSIVNKNDKKDILNNEEKTQIQNILKNASSFFSLIKSTKTTNKKTMEKAVSEKISLDDIAKKIIIDKIKNYSYDDLDLVKDLNVFNDDISNITSKNWGKDFFKFMLSAGANFFLKQMLAVHINAKIVQLTAIANEYKELLQDAFESSEFQDAIKFRFDNKKKTLKATVEECIIFEQIEINKLEATQSQKLQKIKKEIKLSQLTTESLQKHLAKSKHSIDNQKENEIKNKKDEIISMEKIIEKDQPNWEPLTINKNLCSKLLGFEIEEIFRIKPQYFTKITELNHKFKIIKKQIEKIKNDVNYAELCQNKFTTLGDINGIPLEQISILPDKFENILESISKELIEKIPVPGNLMKETLEKSVINYLNEKYLAPNTVSKKKEIDINVFKKGMDDEITSELNEYKNKFNKFFQNTEYKINDLQLVKYNDKDEEIWNTKVNQIGNINDVICTIGSIGKAVTDFETLKKWKETDAKEDFFNEVDDLQEKIKDLSSYQYLMNLKSIINPLFNEEEKAKEMEDFEIKYEAGKRTYHAALQIQREKKDVLETAFLNEISTLIDNKEGSKDILTIYEEYNKAINDIFTKYELTFPNNFQDYIDQFQTAKVFDHKIDSANLRKSFNDKLDKFFQYKIDPIIFSAKKKVQEKILALFKDFIPNSMHQDEAIKKTLVPYIAKFIDEIIKIVISINTVKREVLIDKLKEYLLKPENEKSKEKILEMINRIHEDYLSCCTNYHDVLIQGTIDFFKSLNLNNSKKLQFKDTNDLLMLYKKPISAEEEELLKTNLANKQIDDELFIYEPNCYYFAEVLNHLDKGKQETGEEILLLEYINQKYDMRKTLELKYNDRKDNLDNSYFMDIFDRREKKWENFSIYIEEEDPNEDKQLKKKNKNIPKPDPQSNPDPLAKKVILQTKYYLELDMNYSWERSSSNKVPSSTSSSSLWNLLPGTSAKNRIQWKLTDTIRDKISSTKENYRPHNVDKINSLAYLLIHILRKNKFRDTLMPEAQKEFDNFMKNFLDYKDEQLKPNISDIKEKEKELFEFYQKKKEKYAKTYKPLLTSSMFNEKRTVDGPLFFDGNINILNEDIGKSLDTNIKTFSMDPLINQIFFDSMGIHSLMKSINITMDNDNKAMQDIFSYKNIPARMEISPQYSVIKLLNTIFSLINRPNLSDEWKKRLEDLPITLLNSLLKYYLFHILNVLYTYGMDLFPQLIAYSPDIVLNIANILQELMDKIEAFNKGDTSALSSLTNPLNPISGVKNEMSADTRVILSSHSALIDGTSQLFAAQTLMPNTKKSNFDTIAKDFINQAEKINNYLSTEFDNRILAEASDTRKKIDFFSKFLREEILKWGDNQEYAFQKFQPLLKQALTFISKVSCYQKYQDFSKNYTAKLLNIFNDTMKAVEKDDLPNWILKFDIFIPILKNMIDTYEEVNKEDPTLGNVLKKDIDEFIEKNEETFTNLEQIYNYENKVNVDDKAIEQIVRKERNQDYFISPLISKDYVMLERLLIVLTRQYQSMYAIAHELAINTSDNVTQPGAASINRTLFSIMQYISNLKIHLKFINPNNSIKDKDWEDIWKSNEQYLLINSSFDLLSKNVNIWESSYDDSGKQITIINNIKNNNSIINPGLNPLSAEDISNGKVGKIKKVSLTNMFALFNFEPLKCHYLSVKNAKYIHNIHNKIESLSKNTITYFMEDIKETIDNYNLFFNDFDKFINQNKKRNCLTNEDNKNIFPTLESLIEQNNKVVGIYYIAFQWLVNVISRKLYESNKLSGINQVIKMIQSLPLNDMSPLIANLLKTILGSANSPKWIATHIDQIIDNFLFHLCPNIHKESFLDLLSVLFLAVFVKKDIISGKSKINLLYSYNLRKEDIESSLKQIIDMTMEHYFLQDPETKKKIEINK